MSVITKQRISTQINQHARKHAIAIYCRSFEEGGDPFSSDYYWQAYQDLLLALKDMGMDAYFVSDNNTYRGNGLFEVAYTISEKTKLTDLAPVNNVKVDLVFDRGGFIGRDVTTINPGELQLIGMNKIEMYRHFPKFQPYSVICEDKQAVEEAFQKITGEKIVVKEPEGCGGKEVYIGEKQTVLAALPDRYPVLVQEFLDTSAGVPGSITGVHDVRLSVCGGQFIGYYIRQAKPGALHSNVSRGGTMAFFDVSKIPVEVAEAAHEIDELFAGRPRYYAIDFMYTPKGWKMLELNPYLALFPVTDGIEAQKTLIKLTNYLVTTCQAVRAQ